MKPLFFFLRNFVFFICFFVLLLLLARNPFSDRNLISVLDPFPDTIHYTNSAFSIIRGHGYVIEREGRSIKPDVAPLYPFALVPFFILFNDVRAFYFANAILAITSFSLFFLIVKKTFSRKRVQFLVLFSYLACLPLSWYPTLAMAENLTLPLFLLAINLLISKFSLKKSFVMALVCTAFYATKYASMPLSFAGAFLYIMKIWFESNDKQIKIKRVVNFVIPLILSALIYEIFEYISKGTSIITQLFPLFLKVFIIKSNVAIEANSSAAQNVFFSTEFIKKNLSLYLNWLVGGQLYILWNLTQILSPIWAIPSFVSLIAALFIKKFRFLAFSLVFFLTTVLVFMMSFYTTDGRYFYTAIPTLLIGLGFFFSFILDFLNKKASFGVTVTVSFLIILVFCLPSILPIKSAIMLNLRHAETPWPYISIQRLNVYFKNKKEGGSTVVPVVITPLSPYYVDYFKTEKMTLLPLNNTQEAREKKQDVVWGKYNFEDLHQVYTDQIKQDIPVYFASYGIGNDKSMKEARALLETDFILKEVDPGCLGVCNLYQLELKKDSL